MALPPPLRKPFRADEAAPPMRLVEHEETEELEGGWAAGGKRRRDGGEGSWLISYADMMTLLVGFFALLLSFSKIDSAQYEKIKRETTKVFGGEYVVPFEKLTTNIKGVVIKSGVTDQVYFTENDSGIEMSFRGALFFDSGSFDLRPQAKQLLDNLIPQISLEAKGFAIVIEGHTDNVPLGHKRLTNWELSSLRACTVLRLFESRGFPRERMKAIGWGDTRPIMPNNDKNGVGIIANQAQNRRVVLKILRSFED